MTPAARLSAAIAVLDRILAGEGAEQALTGWGRASRFAGSGDRAAVRDLVFDALRCRRSFAALGGGLTGRGLILGGLREAGADVSALFTGEGHAPPPVAPDEGGHPPEGNEALDCPDWLVPPLAASLGEDFAPVLRAMRHRAPVFLRVNAARCGVAEAGAALAADGISTRPVSGVNFALEVTENARKIQSSRAYADGLVELQDAASQAVVEGLPLSDGMKVLDYCAGGGGKTLAMAARARLRLFAHDAAPGRMRDLPARATRAGARVTLCENPDRSAPYDLILADAPCSGSGSWRRDPQGKWALTPARVAELTTIQAGILDRIGPMVAPGGWLGYATCSLLDVENASQIKAFQSRTPGWTLAAQHRFTPLTGGDGFFLALLRRN
ncbi:MAG: RsmB/NOP family class I SAM-dependent RNA methyltransferase [Paracoccaceae bacterium]